LWNNRKCGIVIDICDGNDLYFSPASCVPDLATKTGRHDIAESGAKTQKNNNTPL
jgi:hypothetical protein